MPVPDCDDRICGLHDSVHRKIPDQPEIGGSRCVDSVCLDLRGGYRARCSDRFVLAVGFSCGLTQSREGEDSRGGYSLAPPQLDQD